MVRDNGQNGGPAPVFMPHTPVRITETDLYTVSTTATAKAVSPKPVRSDNARASPLKSPKPQRISSPSTPIILTTVQTKTTAVPIPEQRRFNRSADDLGSVEADAPPRQRKNSLTNLSKSAPTAKAAAKDRRPSFLRSLFSRIKDAPKNIASVTAFAFDDFTEVQEV